MTTPATVTKQGERVVLTFEHDEFRFGRPEAMELGRQLQRAALDGTPDGVVPRLDRPGGSG